ncbi:hypothetical protein H0H92_011117 [Tricholoma furcatifolium]|nr:hypothetical protein H0H92_011117 [Tricholoma furcatifolium]
MHEFVSSHQDHPEPELLIPMVALAATGIHAALSEWEDGTRNTSFDGTAYQEHYRRHVGTLEAYHRDHPLEFHRVMSTLFSCVVSQSASPQMSQSMPTHGALALLALPDSDSD